MLQLSVLQLSPLRSDRDANIMKISALIEGHTSDILVLPELCSTGYLFTEKEELMELAEAPEEGAFCSFLRAYSESEGTVVVAGFAERDANDRLYNSAITAFPDGSYSIYRKTHLFYKEKSVFEPGDSGFEVLDWNGFRIGTMICYDWRFPEASRTLALGGADIIAHPSNLVAAASLWRPVMGVRAIENKVIVATANRSGGEVVGDELLSFSGESQIVDYNGSVLASCGASDEVVIGAGVNPEGTRKKSFNPFNDLFSDRRPELYRL